jgi:hypothetical protein
MLMPPPRLEEDAKKLDGKKSIVYDLSNKYFVSRQAMRIQLQRLGFNTDIPAIPERQVKLSMVANSGCGVENHYTGLMLTLFIRKHDNNGKEKIGDAFTVWKMWEGKNCRR